MIDTSVLVASMRSRTGASRKLVNLVLDRQLGPLVSVPLVLEYEAVMLRREHLEAARTSEESVIDVVKAFCEAGEPVHVERRLRPQMVDPDDEFVLEAAYFGRAEAIVTLNLRDFLPAARRFGIAVWTPREALERIQP